MIFVSEQTHRASMLPNLQRCLAFRGYATWRETRSPTMSATSSSLIWTLGRIRVPWTVECGRSCGLPGSRRAKSKLRLPAVVRRPWLFEASLDMRTWLPIGTNTVPTNGFYECYDWIGPDSGTFYRARLLP